MVQLLYLRATVRQAVQVVDVVEMADGECISYKTPAGDMKVVCVPGHRWQELVARTPAELMATSATPRWIEVYVDNDSDFHFSWLHTSDEFDALPRSLRYRELDEVNGYNKLKAAHLVPESISGSKELYYDQAF